MSSASLQPNHKKLIKRYLIWCYKTTQEELDWIDRKFTQLEVDRFVLKKLNDFKKNNAKLATKALNIKIKEFSKYIDEKDKRAYENKYDSRKKHFHPNYVYLTARLKAVESSIIKFLGKKDLQKIQSLYQEQMIKRILESREH